MVDNHIPLGTLRLADCIDKLFGLKLSKYPKLKDALESMRRNEIIKAHTTAALGGKNSRGKVYYQKDQLTTIYNATLLYGIFADSLIVRDIFEKTTKRLEMTQWLSSLLQDRNSVVGIGLISQEVVRFLNVLGSDADLREVRLANPFVELPQLSLGSVTSIIQGMLIQSAVLSTGDSMMVAYLNGELERAWKLASELDTDNAILLLYRQLIINEYDAAVEFDETLDFFR